MQFISMEFLNKLEITSAKQIDLAYFYLTVNGFTRRVPPGLFTFMQGSGYKFDLTQYLLETVELLPDGGRI